MHFSESAPNLTWHYTIGAIPAQHCFTIALDLRGWQQETLDLHMPVWSPGSYLVREYARLVQEFRVATSDGRNLAHQKVAKNCWRLAATPEMTISYQVFANDLTVRTNHIDHSHGYCNGASTFLFSPGYEHLPITLEIVLPNPEWRIATALPPLSDRSHTFWAKDFHTLVDSPIEMGIHERIDFEVFGKPHHFVIWGKGNGNLAQITADTTHIITEIAHIFRSSDQITELPYDRYWFLLHLSSTGNGGLEHRDCCSLNYLRLGLRGESYLRFLNLVAHEFFHTWNVKRLRPKDLEVINYDQENYTRLLWFAEGITSYYDQLIPLRAGIYDAKHFLKLVSENITRYLSTPGRWEQPLAESSFDTWIKLYRPDANTQNTQISYYLKGDLVSMLLDLQIRISTDHQSCLDNVLSLMWEEFGKKEKGYTEEDIFNIINTVTGTDLANFLNAYIHTTADLDFNYFFQPFGLQLLPITSQYSPPFLGMNVKTFQGCTIVQYVEAKSPAQTAGIVPGDELLAIDGIRVNSENLTDRLRDFAPGDTITAHLFQRDQLLTAVVTLQPPQPERYSVTRLNHSTIGQQQNLQKWLGTNI